MTTAKATRIVGAKDLLLYTFAKDDIKKLAERLERKLVKIYSQRYKILFWM
ncbi:MAG: hypothetical protein WCF23_06510 [Candidatus Nitrosopolaris sp.]